MTKQDVTQLTKRSTGKHEQGVIENKPPTVTDNVNYLKEDLEWTHDKLKIIQDLVYKECCSGLVDLVGLRRKFQK